MKAAIDAKMTRWEGQFVCTDCDYSTKNSSDLRRHIEAKHVQTAGWECSVCNKFCPTKNAYEIHFRRYHK